MFTVVRHLFELYICKALINWLNLDKESDRSKFPESFWKLTAYSCLWSYCSYLLVFSGEYDYFTHSYDIWNDWSLNMNVPDAIKWLYFIECGFYLHSIYATLYMDAKRKDFLVMLFHHFLTLALIIVSYATRYHKIGILVVFVHDATDIILEFTKCNVYMKYRNKKYHPINETISNVGFGFFAVGWFVFRLYWFPLKILYSTSVVSVYTAVDRGAGLYGFFNVLLWFLLGLDLYWFQIIVAFMIKVAMGQIDSFEDTRETELEQEKSKSKKN